MEMAKNCTQLLILVPAATMLRGFLEVTEVTHHGSYKKEAVVILLPLCLNVFREI
jgi:hypothetical protein